MAWSKETANEMLNMWLGAERAVATGQSYRIGTRELTRADLSEIAERITFWRKEVDKLEDGKGRGARVFRASPMDF